MSLDSQGVDAHVSLLSLVEDVFRCWDPSRLSSARSVVSAASAGGAAGEALLASSLERQYGIAGYFVNYGAHFAGRHFDARRALYDGNIVPPIPAASPFDNVHKAQAMLCGGRVVDSDVNIVATGRLHTHAVAAADAQRRVRRPRVPPLHAIADAAVSASLAATDADAHVAVDATTPLSLLSRALLTHGTTTTVTVALLINAPAPYDAPAFLHGFLASFDAFGNILLRGAGAHVIFSRGDTFSRLIAQSARPTPPTAVNANTNNALTLIPAHRIILIAVLES